MTSPSTPPDLSALSISNSSNSRFEHDYDTLPGGQQHAYHFSAAQGHSPYATVGASPLRNRPAARGGLPTVRTHLFRFGTASQPPSYSLPRSDSSGRTSRGCPSSARSRPRTRISPRFPRAGPRRWAMLPRRRWSRPRRCRLAPTRRSSRRRSSSRTSPSTSSARRS